MKQKQLPSEINKMTGYLAHTFAVSMQDPVNSEEDLKQDLLLFYFENYNTKVTNKEWFIRFKNKLIDQFRRLGLERKHIIKLDDYVISEE